MRRRLLVENELPIKPIEEANYADICLVDNNSLEKLIVSGDDYDINIFPINKYTPIGVVVVPTSHTNDGTARVMSLAAMNLTTPDVGSTEEHTHIYWGKYDNNVPDLPILRQAPYITNDIENISGEQQLLGFITTNYLYFSSDQYTNYPNPYDEGTYYRIGTITSSLDKGLPSPYLTGGDKNPIYHDTSNTANALADMDGKVNTEKILSVDNSLGTDWQTASTISNDDAFSKDYHPSAQCCWRYHTIGTNQGDWYLPAMGELGYLAARWKAINNSINKLVFLNVKAIILPVDHNYWSSTNGGVGSANALYFFSDNAKYSLVQKYDGDHSYVRAFLSV